MKLVEITEVYSQDEDCCGRPDDICQQIEISTENGGGGSYLVVKTERWAVDDIDELVRPMRDLLKRIHEAEEKK